jgi:hypothetical protein
MSCTPPPEFGITIPAPQRRAKSVPGIEERRSALFVQGGHRATVGENYRARNARSAECCDAGYVATLRIREHFRSAVRGVIAVGKFADIIVCDARTITDRDILLSRELATRMLCDRERADRDR